MEEEDMEVDMEAVLNTAATVEEAEKDTKRDFMDRKNLHQIKQLKK